MNLVHILTIYLRSILILSSHLHLGLQTDLFPSGFKSENLHSVLIYSTRATKDDRDLRYEGVSKSFRTGRLEREL
jgi:hypothetical protein